MDKREFLERLESGLAGLPKDDIEERIAFYGEMIEDRIEEGLPEEEAVDEIGSPDEIAWQIIADYPLSKLVKNKMKPKRRLRTWEIVLLAVGSPIWLTLLVSAVSVVVSLYISIWAIIVSFWALGAALVGVAIGGIVCGVVFVVGGNVLTGVTMFGAALFSAGLSIFAFFGCGAATDGILMLTKKIVIGIKNFFIRKGEEK